MSAMPRRGCWVLAMRKRPDTLRPHYSGLDTAMALTTHQHTLPSRGCKWALLCSICGKRRGSSSRLCITETVIRNRRVIFANYLNLPSASNRAFAMSTTGQRPTLEDQLRSCRWARRETEVRTKAICEGSSWRPNLISGRRHQKCGYQTDSSHSPSLPCAAAGTQWSGQ